MTTTKIEDRSAMPAKRQRIAKLMARVGLCSRRDAEAWIVAGRVSVNGEVLTSPARDIGDDDTVLIDGAPLPAAEKTRLFLFHKPRGLVTSDHDPEGRATVFDYLSENWPEGPRVVSIGRLDINTEGLLLLTNDGGLARLLELPQTGWVRRYRVRAKGTAAPAALETLANGITIDGIDYAGIEAKLDRVQGANCWLTVGLREGKNREVKRVLEHLGLEVNRLIRVSFGPFQLLDLEDGAVEEVRTRVLRDQLGPSLAAQAGVSFETAEAATPPVNGTPAVKKAPRQQQPRERSDHRSFIRAAGVRPAEDLRQRDVAPQRRERPAAGTRKHISALRATERTSKQDGARKRVERSDTRDRRARTIAVERLVSTRRSAPEGRQPRKDRLAEGNRRARSPRREEANHCQTEARADRDARGGDERSRDTRGRKTHARNAQGRDAAGPNRPGRTAPGRNALSNKPHGNKPHSGKPNSRDTRERHSEGGRRRESPAAEAKRQRQSLSGGDARPRHNAARAEFAGGRKRQTTPSGRPAPNKQGRRNERRQPTVAKPGRSTNAKPLRKPTGKPGGNKPRGGPGRSKR